MSHDWTWVEDVVREAKSASQPSQPSTTSNSTDAAELKLAEDILAAPLSACKQKSQVDHAKSMQTAKTWSIAFGVAFIVISSFAHGWFAWKHADL